MATIYDDIRNEFSEKLSEEKYSSKINNQDLDIEILDLALETLIEQIRDIRRQNITEETNSKINTDANALINTIDRSSKSF
ncbi:hypothetical protein RM549_03035 [Salegentibacter sp. F188]|uniref:Uncharacterized protein n=1 Tax=Autumnicola patrickiae TaxID=3075591 RepID=A0ABU3DYG3_9FLAO|nr:hypothetical protein [Salegentibacter sp. F188]MDT0688740.1 hypothetical protein [Salegentibacter sp. F188]